MEKHSKSIRIDRSLSLPAYVKEALQILDEAGHIAYVVGGCVRDFLLGKDIKDYDIATSANPQELCRLFPRAITVGKAFGVIKVPTDSSPNLLEIATFRQDGDYQNHRHPVSVTFTGPWQDAQRRDFSINALFYDPKTQRIIDSVGGYEDLKNGLIRAIGNPAERFREDALRLLRAVRFQARFQFQLHADTADAIRAKAHLISKVSAERVRDELTEMWTGPSPSEALKTLSELKLLQYVLPEVEALKGITQIPSHDRNEDLWNHMLKTLRHLERQSPTRSMTMAWAAILHEIGKPVIAHANADKNFNGHEIESAKLAEKIAMRLKMPRADVSRIAAMVNDHLKFREVFQMRESTLQRFIRQEYFEEILAFHRADAAASDGNLAFHEFCLNRFETLKRAAAFDLRRLIDGKDLIQLGFSPGPEFSEILRTVEDLALEKKLNSKEEALEYVIKNFVR